MRRVLIISSFLIAVFCASTGVFLYSSLQALTELQRRAQSDLALASDRLVSGLFSYRQLAVALASDPRLVTLKSGPELDKILRDAADFSGALDFVLLDQSRQVVAAAALGEGLDWRWPFVDRAFHGALGRDVGISGDYGRRVFYYTAPVFSDGGPVGRVIVAVIDLEAIEAEFRGSRPAIFVSDEAGVIYFSNRSELVFRDRNLGPDVIQSEDETLAPFFQYTARQLMGFNLWRASAGRYVPTWALHLVRDLPVIGMRAEALVDLRPVVAGAGQQAAATGAVIFLLGTVILVVARQRRILSRTNQRLEQRVVQRTAELSDANASLRAEIVERQEAEAALRQAQEDLVQAEKLSALGKMSAGISHELNQPLMAIQSFADNAATFLDRGKPQTAAGNLSKISALAGRMGRIIQNFRTFARQEREVVHRVELGAIVRGAVDLAQMRLRAQGTRMTLDLPEAPVWVQGGEVRLHQVVLNLVSNAIDAMEGGAGPEIRITLTPSSAPGAPVLLTVRDTGPGIDAPEKVFEPFYTTKTIGEAEGVGLGLSISYGLVQSFGGQIRGQNHPEGGAVFTVELQPWSDQEAA